jgi:hypothetical protein
LLERVFTCAKLSKKGLSEKHQKKQSKSSE